MEMLNLDVFNPSQLQAVKAALQGMAADGLTIDDTVAKIGILQHRRANRQLPDAWKPRERNIDRSFGVCSDCGSALVPAWNDGTFEALACRKCRKAYLLKD